MLGNTTPEQNPFTEKVSSKTTVPSDKFILDATAGFRMMWFDKHQKNTIYLDQRPECEPDIVGDFRDLKQFPDETFKLIVFDPPHLMERNGNPQASDMYRKYGALKVDSWQSDLKSAFQEFFRILKPFGMLILKWCDASMSSFEIIKLSPISPLFYQISSMRHKKGSKSGSAEIRTLWFCFMKIPQEATKP